LEIWRKRSLTKPVCQHTKVRYDANYSIPVDYNPKLSQI
jgi:hypothetical protein